MVKKCSMKAGRWPVRASTLWHGTTVYSPWTERQGDYLRATADLVATAGCSLIVQAYTKDKEDTGDGDTVDAGTSIILGSTGRQVAEWSPSTGTGLKQLVRYKFIADGQTGRDWLSFRMLNPVWFDAVNAT